MNQNINMKGRKMALKNRTIQWCEAKIIEVLAKRKQVTTSLALCSNVLWDGVRSLTEQHNFDEALLKLLIRREVLQEKDKDGFTTFRLAA